MNLIRFSGFLAAVAIGFVSCASPARAGSYDRTSPARSIDAILRVEPDFFDRGREMFERDIERFMQNQLDNSDTPLLIIDESALFDADAFEMLEEQPTSPDIVPLPTAP